MNHVVDDINYLMTETKWVKSQSNCGIWTAMLLSRKICVVTNDYNFLPNNKSSIQQLVSQSKSRI